MDQTRHEQIEPRNQHRKRRGRKKEEIMVESDPQRTALLSAIDGCFQNFTPEFPFHLQHDLFDIGILGTENDRPAMQKIKQLFQKFITNGDGEPVDVVTIDRNAAHISRDFRLEEILKRATLYFLLVSDDFLQNSWAKFVKTEAIEKVLEENYQCVIPVFPDRKQRCVFGFSGIKGINIMDLLNGKSLREINVEMLTQGDVNQNIVAGIEKVVRKYSYVKTKRRIELDEQRNIFTEKEKLRIIRETMNNQLETRPTADPGARAGGSRGGDLPIRQGAVAGDTLEVILDGGLKVYLPVESVRFRPAVDNTPKPIDLNTPGCSRVRADSNSSGSSYEELLLDEFDKV